MNSRCDSRDTGLHINDLIDAKWAAFERLLVFFFFFRGAEGVVG